MKFRDFSVPRSISMHKLPFRLILCITAICMSIYTQNPIVGCLFSHGISDSSVQVLQYLPKDKQMADNQLVTILFSHGVGDTNKLATVYQNGSKKDAQNRSTIPFRTFSFDYEDARPGKFYKIPRISNTSLAQTNEILRFKDAFLSMSKTLQEEQGSNYKIVLYGLSRGASTIIMFLATYPELCNHVAAVIVESPFDSIDTIITSKIQSMGLEKVVSLQAGQRIFQSIFKLYNPTFPAPANVITKIPYEIPIIFVCTKEDATVPHHSTKNLYHALLFDGHDKAHLIEVERGKHGKILQGPDGDTYQKEIFHFYKKYGLLKD